jgi:hypothetical protein
MGLKGGAENNRWDPGSLEGSMRERLQGFNLNEQDPFPSVCHTTSCRSQAVGSSLNSVHGSVSDRCVVPGHKRDGNVQMAGVRSSYLDCCPEWVFLSHQSAPGKGCTVGVECKEMYKIDSSITISMHYRKQDQRCPCKIAVDAAAHNGHYRETGQGLVRIPHEFLQMGRKWRKSNTFISKIIASLSQKLWLAATRNVALSRQWKGKPGPLNVKR